MRTAITLRLDADLLAAARVEARRDSRTLTNLIEVALKRHLQAAAGPHEGRVAPASRQDAAAGPAHAGTPDDGGAPGDGYGRR